MPQSIDARLQTLGIELPEAALPVANYVPFSLVGELLYISGQLPMQDGVVQLSGKLGDTVSVEQGQAAARLCAINLLAQAKAALGGDLFRIHQLVRLGGFVSCLPEFIEHPKVINGASDLMVEVLGDAGRHVRVAVGAPSLPMGAAVEVEGLFRVA